MHEFVHNQQKLQAQSGAMELVSEWGGLMRRGRIQDLGVRQGIWGKLKRFQ